MGSCLSGEHRGRSLPNALSNSPASTSGLGKRKKYARRNSSSSSIEANMEMWLHRIQGRMFLNGSTQVASLFCKQGKKGVNQDAMIVWENFCSKADTIFCGVFDGHGPYGHKIAKKVRDLLPLKFSAQWELMSSGKGAPSDVSSSAMGSINPGGLPVTQDDEKSIALQNEHINNQSSNFLILKESFEKACKVMDKELKIHPDINSYCSGTTAVTLIKQGQELVIGNVGDSRAVLATRDNGNALIPIQLTVDLKPSLPREAERIKLFKGRVYALRQEPEVARVWLPNADSPGLAMARAFGDFCLKDYGIISVPDVSYHHLTERDEFIVLATDGIWDVLSNKEVVDIVASTPKISAAQTLVNVAVKAWRVKYPYSKVDDCAVVCLFFNSDPQNETAQLANGVHSESSAIINDDGKSVVRSGEHDSLLGEEGTQHQVEHNQH